MKWEVVMKEREMRSDRGRDNLRGNLIEHEVTRDSKSMKQEQVMPLFLYEK